jgi:hypothetical protein
MSLIKAFSWVIRDPLLMPTDLGDVYRFWELLYFPHRLYLEYFKRISYSPIYFLPYINPLRKARIGKVYYESYLLYIILE